MRKFTKISNEIMFSPEWMELSTKARLIYFGCHMLADSHGCLKDNPIWIQAQVLMGNKQINTNAVDQALNELVNVGWVLRGKGWIELVGWDEAMGSDFTRRRGKRRAPKLNEPTILKATIETPPKPKQPKPKQPKQAEDNSAQEVFNTWVEVAAPIQLADPERARLTKDRRQKIEARLADGKTVEELQHAIQGFAKDSFHSGENDRRKPYLDFSTIFRNNAKVDEGIRLYAGTRKASGDDEWKDLVGEGKQYATKDEYDAALQRILDRMQNR